MALTPQIRVPQAVALALISYPAEEIQATEAAVDAVFNQVSQSMQVTQAAVLAVVRGRVDDPRVRAWTYSLDGHDFYVLRCGNTETLIYDTLSKEWYVWGSSEGDLWRAYTGFNWLGGRWLGRLYSNVVVGDDGNGALYFLDPNGYEDDDALQGSVVPRPFTREITAQYVMAGGYASVPCYGVQLFGSAGQVEEDLTVELQISDDRGQSFTSMGSLDIDAGDYAVRVNWQSLGSMDAPGRLFKIIDTGALQRVDHLVLEAPGGE